MLYMPLEEDVQQQNSERLEMNKNLSKDFKTAKIEQVSSVRSLGVNSEANSGNLETQENENQRKRKFEWVLHPENKWRLKWELFIGM